MIGGVDLVLQGRTQSDDADFILRALRRLWPLAHFQKGDAEEATPLSSVRFPVIGIDELFVFRDAESLQSWQNLGATPDNEDSMIHVIVSPQEVTIVVDRRDGPLAAAAEEIFDGLRDKRRMRRTTGDRQQVTHAL